MWGIFAKPGRQQAGALYAQIVAQARLPVFYTRLCVPDTIEGRLELITLHCHAVMRRLHRIGPGAFPASQELLQYMFDDLDRSIREIGVGDVSIGKYMKKLGKGFYGRAEAYDRALDAGDAQMLGEALRRNLLGTSEADPAALDRAVPVLADYVSKMAAQFESYDLAALQTSLSFPEVNA
jgi:cytochrome b pre-mRNA-processing protein 3